jgi:hypothetical protein
MEGAAMQNSKLVTRAIYVLDKLNNTKKAINLYVFIRTDTITSKKDSQALRTI